MPQPVVRMDRDAERRGMHRLGAHRPALEGPYLRTEGVDGARSEFLGNRAHDAPRPAVERFPLAVDVRHECFPHRPAGIADKNNRPSVLAADIAGTRMKS